MVEILPAIVRLGPPYSFALIIAFKVGVIVKGDVNL